MGRRNLFTFGLIQINVVIRFRQMHPGDTSNLMDSVFLRNVTAFFCVRCV